VPPYFTLPTDHQREGNILSTRKEKGEKRKKKRGRRKIYIFLLVLGMSRRQEGKKGEKEGKRGTYPRTPRLRMLFACVAPTYRRPDDKERKERKGRERGKRNCGLFQLHSSRRLYCGTDHG